MSKNYDLSVKLTDREKSIVIGSLLGDASISRGKWKGVDGNARVRFVQGIAQLPYLEWKQEEMKKWIGTPINTIPIPTQFGGLIHRVSTLTHPVFTEIWNLIKPENSKKKRITPELLPYLDDLAIAVWFMDDGSMMQTSCGATIATYAFYPEDLNLVCQYLTEKKKIICKVQNTCKGNIITINSVGTLALRELIAPYIHPVLAYKGTPTPRETICAACGKIFMNVTQRKTCNQKCQRDSGIKTRHLKKINGCTA